jgi:predicted NUDIX family NTP pyrophosphohydrolase
MAKKSAGILLYRKFKNDWQFFLVHPGGPFWAKKDLGAWSLPKGEFESEEPLDAAIREFEEEIGTRLSGDFKELTPLKQKSGKMVYAWALEGNIEKTKITSNYFDLEWPPGSGKIRQYPEVDKAGWFTYKEALEKIIPGQQGFIKELTQLLEHLLD